MAEAVRLLSKVMEVMTSRLTRSCALLFVTVVIGYAIFRSCSTMASFQSDSTFPVAEPKLTGRSLRADTVPTKIGLTYLYIVGVKGVGHHGISPAIATIASTCNNKVIFEPDRLRPSQRKKAPISFQANLKIIRSVPATFQNVVVVEDASFPTGVLGRSSNSTEKKLEGAYDLEWVHDQLTLGNATVKYLYLNRDFYRTVASHPHFDGGFQQHAQVLSAFIEHIGSEHQIINSKQPGLWKQISYEWFTNMDVYNCTAIVSAVIDFMEWDHCDVKFACDLLYDIVRRETQKPLVRKDYTYAKSFNVTLSIPMLDISPGQVFNFTTVVSERRPIEIAQDTEGLWSDPVRRTGPATNCAACGTQIANGAHSRAARQRAAAASLDLPVPRRDAAPRKALSGKAGKAGETVAQR